jgi:hypothetical protein
MPHLVGQRTVVSHFGGEVKKTIKREPDGQTIDSAVLPSASSISSRSFGGKSSAASRKKRHPSITGTRRFEEMDGVPCCAEKTNPTARVALSTKPYNFAVKPSLVAMEAINGVESVINFWMQRKNSADEISFLFMVKESSLEEAIFWAKRLGLKYQKPLAMLRQLL